MGQVAKQSVASSHPHKLISAIRLFCVWYIQMFLSWWLIENLKALKSIWCHQLQLQEMFTDFQKEWLLPLRLSADTALSSSHLLCIRPIRLRPRCEMLLLLQQLLGNRLTVRHGRGGRRPQPPPRINQLAWNELNRWRWLRLEVGAATVGSPARASQRSLHLSG